MGNRKLVAGVDSSTQSTKIVIRDAQTGELIRQARASHPDGTEVDPLHWKNALDTAMKEIGGIDVIGPVLLGMKKPVNVLQLGSSVRNIINMATVAVVDAQLKTRIDTEAEVQRTSWWKRMKKRKK
jgi:UDP-N-acetyl-D-mannosaminuronic acid transferase (WecB/TagA/CpsF family)